MFVASIGRQEQSVEWNLRNGFQAHMEVVETVDRAQHLVDGRICSPNWPRLDGNHGRITLAQPGDELSEMNYIDRSPVYLLLM